MTKTTFVIALWTLFLMPFSYGMQKPGPTSADINLLEYATIDLYSIFGVSSICSRTELKERYHILIKKWHPDQQSGKSAQEIAEAKAQSKQINAAYRVLSDSSARKDYDALRQASTTSSQPSTSSASNSHQSTYQYSNNSQSIPEKFRKNKAKETAFKDLLARSTITKGIVIGFLNSTIVDYKKFDSEKVPNYKARLQIARLYYCVIKWLLKNSFPLVAAAYHQEILYFQIIERCPKAKIRNKIQVLLHKCSTKMTRSYQPTTKNFQKNKLRETAFKTLLRDHDSKTADFPMTKMIATTSLVSLVSEYKQFDSNHPSNYKARLQISKLYYYFIKWLLKNDCIKDAQTYYNKILNLNIEEQCTDPKIQKKAKKIKKEAYKRVTKAQSNSSTSKESTSSQPATDEKSTSQAPTRQFKNASKEEIIRLLANNIDNLNIDLNACINSYKYYCAKYNHKQDFVFKNLSNCKYLKSSNLKQKIDKFLVANKIDPAQNPITTNYELLQMLAATKNMHYIKHKDIAYLFNYLANPNNYVYPSYKKTFMAAAGTGFIFGVLITGFFLAPHTYDMSANKKLLCRIAGLASCVTGLFIHKKCSNFYAAAQTRFQGFMNYNKIINLSQTWVKNNS